jgi:hypothetical protein
MGTLPDAIIEAGATHVGGSNEKRRRRSKLERRRIVEETLVPGASVARVTETGDKKPGNRGTGDRRDVSGGFCSGSSPKSVAVVKPC